NDRRRHHRLARTGRRRQGHRRRDAIAVIQLTGTPERLEDVINALRLVGLERELHRAPLPASISKLRKYASYRRTGSTWSGSAATNDSNNRSSSVTMNAVTTSLFSAIAFRNISDWS